MTKINVQLYWFCLNYFSGDLQIIVVAVIQLSTMTGLEKSYIIWLDEEKEGKTKANKDLLINAKWMFA